MKTSTLMGGRLAAALVLGAGCSGGSTASPSDGGTNLPSFTSTCTAVAPSAEARRTAGRQGDGSVILPGGRKLTPAGRVLDVGGFPLAMRVLPGDRYVAITDGAYGYEALRIVDTRAPDPRAAVVSSREYPRTSGTPHSPALFYGLALTADGKRLYASNGGYDPVDDAVDGKQHFNTIDVFDLVGDPPKLTPAAAGPIKLMFNAGNGAASQRLPAGLQLSADGKLLYVACQSDATLAIVDVASGQEIGRAALPGLGPYDVAVDEKSHTAFVSLWGGLKKSATVFVDGIVVVDVTNPMAPVAQAEPLATGKAAEAELLLAGKLYVTNTDADTLSIVDTAARTVVTTPTLAGNLIGAAPNHIAVDSAAGRLYLANAGENSVAALDLTTLAVIGHLPTAWYPTAVAVLGDGSLLVTSGKGLGLGPFDHYPGGDNYSYMQGVLQVIPRPSDADLKAGSAAVVANLDRPRSYQASPTCTQQPGAFPLPVDASARTPIEHVFLLVRENKTYDAVLGDLEGTNGDKSLMVYPAEVTPNAHALARGFTNLDNFYSQAEQSLQGHEWTTAAIANDYTEKGWSNTWGRYYRPFTAFTSGPLQRLPFPGTDTIFVHLDKAGIRYRNYGEITNITGASVALDPQFPGWMSNLDVMDVDKVAYLVDELANPASIAPFWYILLPNDHTYGTSPGKPTPQSMVADNDLATGRFIEALSHSPLWPTSIVFVVEDDPADGGDHVEPHRSIGLVISPWVKKGYVSSANYDVPAIYRTIEFLLHLPPMNLFDGHAAAMYDIFTTTPDYTPYTARPRAVPIAKNSADAPLAEESSRIDFSRFDAAPLGRILWKATHGKDAEPPWRAMLPSARQLTAAELDD